MHTFFIGLLMWLICLVPLRATSLDSLQTEPSTKRQPSRILPGLVIAAGTSFLLDKPTHSFIGKHQTPILKDVANVADFAGEKTIILPALLLTYGTARFITKDARLCRTSLNAMQAVVVTAIATETVKITTGRARPFTENGPWSFQPFPGNRDEYKSLPSGHASLAFAVFTPFAETYSRWIYLIPISVAAGRVYQDKHWLSDVAVGSGLGLISGLLFTHHDNVQIIPNGIRVCF